MKFRKIIKYLKKSSNTIYIDNIPVTYDGEDYVLQDDMFNPTLMRRSAILDGIKKKGVELA